MTQLVTLLLALATPVFASSVPDVLCDKTLGTGEDFIPTDAHKQRLVQKIVEHTGDPLDKTWHAVDAGNVGLHAYLIPHNKAARFLEIATNMFGGQHWEGLRGEYNARHNILVGVLETDDEPTISIVILPKDHREPMRKGRIKLNPTDSADSAEMRKLVPGAWQKGHFVSHHLLWDMLKDGHEVSFPGEDNHRGWTIEAYK